MIEVKFDYFKKTGKWYTSTICDYPDDMGFYDIVDEVKDFQSKGVLPGLVHGATEFHIVLTIKKSDIGLPYLILAKE